MKGESLTCDLLDLESLLKFTFQDFFCFQLAPDMSGRPFPLFLASNNRWYGLLECIQVAIVLEVSRDYVKPI